MKKVILSAILFIVMAITITCSNITNIGEYEVEGANTYETFILKPDNQLYSKARGYIGHWDVKDNILTFTYSTGHMNKWNNNNGTWENIGSPHVKLKKK
ncbi:MAG: hypothetical protein ACJAVA_002763 [Flavobacteriaceae bacterium]|jgi:hypothetical protein